MRDQCNFRLCPAGSGDAGGDVVSEHECPHCVAGLTGQPRMDLACTCIRVMDVAAAPKLHRSGLHLVTPADDYADAPSPFPGSPRQPGIIRMLEDWLRYTKDGHVDACFIVSTTPTGDFMYAVAGQSLREDAWTLVGGIEVAKQHHISLLLEGKLRVKPPADGGGDGKEG